MADITRGNVMWHGAHFMGLLNGDVSAGDPVGNNGTGWVRADSNGPISCMGFALKDGASGELIQITKECIQQTSSDLTTGAPVFLSATAGRIADAVVGAVASVTQCLGWVTRGAGTELMYLKCDIAHIQAKWVTSFVTIIIAGAYINFFIADRHYRVVGAREVHSVAGGDGGAVTCTVEKIPSGTAKGSGVNVLSTTFDMKSTANVPVWLGPSATAADILLVPGDRLGTVSSGTQTSLVDAHITVTLIPWNL